MNSTETPAPSYGLKNKFLKQNSFSRTQLIIFAAVFALIGGYILFTSFAASPPIASLEGEQMSQPANSSIVTDTSASGGKALELASTAGTGTTTPTAAKPAIPTGLTASAGNGSVTLSWNANPAGDQVGTYQVYYGTVASFSSFSIFIDSITSTSYKVTGLTNGTTYYFKISAHNSIGYGPWSASPVSATPSASATTSSSGGTTGSSSSGSGSSSSSSSGSPTAKPAIPTGLKATAGNGKVVLKWNANAASDQVNVYQVYYAPNSSFTNFNGYVSSVTGTTYTVSGLTNGKTYYFRVSAHNSVGYGPWTATPVSAKPSATAAINSNADIRTAAVTTPTTATPGILDTFASSTYASPPSSSWSNKIRPGDSAMEENGSAMAAQALGNEGSMWWNQSTFGPDSEAYVTTKTLAGAGNGTYLYVRATNVGTANLDGYAMWSLTNGNTYLFRMTNNVQTQIGYWNISPAPAAGESYMLEAVGSQIGVAYEAPGASTWTVLGTVTDSTYSGAGYIGTGIDYETGLLTNFGGGTVGSTSSGGSTSTSSSITTTGSVNFPSSVTSLTVTAKGDQCSGAPTMNVAVDGTTLISAASVSSTSYSGYSANASLSSGNHTLSISFTNPSATSTCSRNLYIDVTNFYGPAVTTTPAPTVSLSATPTSITAGSASTLTWSSTNATACMASGAWSGAENTAGSSTTGALNQSSTYTLTCTGAGGSASKSASVTVTAASSSSSSSSGGASGGSFVPHAMYDSNGTQSAFTADWPAIKATGVNTLILASEWTSNLQTLAAAGDKGWVTAGHWDDSSESFSESQADAVADVTSACATGAVQGIYIADEPDESLSSTPAADIAAVKARATALKAACPSAVTIMAYWDSTTIAKWKGVTDIIALDGYPSRDGFSNSVITQQAAAADAAGIKYYGVIGAFTDGTSNYPLPTAAQLTSMFNAWQSTNELGWAVYSWGATGAATAQQLQNQPSLLSVIQTASAL